MPTDLLIRGARQLLTLRGPSGPRRGLALFDLGLIADGAILIRNGLIHSLGQTRQVANQARTRGCEEIDATGRVVMPAFVDLETSLVHAHPAPRSFERLLKNYDHPDPEVFREVLEDGARDLAELSSHSLRKRATRIANGMLHYGTATVASKAGYRLDETGTLKVLRVQTENTDAPLEIVSALLLSLPAGMDPSEWASAVIADLLPKVRRRRLATFIDLEYDRDSLPAPLALKVFEAAKQLGFAIRIHADFFALSSAVPLAVRGGAMSVAHMRRIREDEIQMLAATSTIAILKPGISLQTGLSFGAPGREMIDAGVIPAIASGYHAQLSPGYNMQLMLLLACRLYRLSPEEAIAAATINAAHAIGAEGSIGSLEAGKQADIIVLNVSDYREVAYYAGVNIVEKTIKRGVIVHDSASGAVTED